MTRAYLTVTLKRAIVEMARAQVGHGGVKSLSDFVEGAVIERLQKEGASQDSRSGWPPRRGRLGTGKSASA
ncbi:MAG: hypothetical protein JRM77_10030, partial [Nitrososphaerota archaeon]|nr:hypothetical protein [Nitrososphaerota archaeon]